MMKATITIENRALARLADNASRERNPRKKNWNSPRPRKKIPVLGDVESETINYRGRFKGYTGSNFIPIYHSALTMDNRAAVYSYGFAGDLRSRTLRAPSGTEWDHDGSIITRDYSCEYHPTCEDLLARNFAARVRAGLAEAKVRRAAARELKREQDRQWRIYERESASCRVTLLDSRAAGNCIEGSLRFAERKLGLTREEIMQAQWLIGVSASRLLAVANGDAKAVERAIRVAFQRETTVAI